MIQLLLQMFGGRGGKGGGAGGGGTQATGSTGPGQRTSGGGGRGQDGGSKKSTEERERERTREREDRTPVTAVADNETYIVYLYKNGKEEVKGKATGAQIRKLMYYNRNRDAWVRNDPSKTSRYIIRRANTRKK